MGKWKSVLIIYDIEDNKIRNKVVKELESYGIRIQKSAFECYVDSSRLLRLTSRIHKLVGENDSVRMYSATQQVYDIGKDTEVCMYSKDVFIV